MTKPTPTDLLNQITTILEGYPKQHRRAPWKGHVDNLESTMEALKGTLGPQEKNLRGRLQAMKDEISAGTHRPASDTPKDFDQIRGRIDQWMRNSPRRGEKEEYLKVWREVAEELMTLQGSLEGRIDGSQKGGVGKDDPGVVLCSSEEDEVGNTEVQPAGAEVGVTPQARPITAVELMARIAGRRKDRLAWYGARQFRVDLVHFGIADLSPTSMNQVLVSAGVYTRAWVEGAFTR